MTNSIALAIACFSVAVYGCEDQLSQSAPELTHSPIRFLELTRSSKPSILPIKSTRLSGEHTFNNLEGARLIISISPVPQKLLELQRQEKIHKARLAKLEAIYTKKLESPKALKELEPLRKKIALIACQREQLKLESAL